MKALTPLLNVIDGERSARFYCEMLGFHIDNRFDGDDGLLWAQLSRGPVQIMINVSDERKERAQRADAKSWDDVILYFAVDDVHALRRELVARGCEPAPVKRQAYGLDEFTLRDPDGYELGFGSRIRRS